VDLTSVAARLKVIREAKGVTKYRLAKVSGVSETYIYRIERGLIENPRRDTLQKLANGLNITLAQLVEETNPSDAWQLVELSLKAYIPVYNRIGAIMGPVDYIATTRAEVPPTLCAYRIEGLYYDPEVLPGDTIICDTALEPSDGDLVVVVSEGEPVIKRYIRQEWQGDVSVHGVITELVRKLR
jgi:transcriptional regulator with XRE-family HTH domain